MPLYISCNKTRENIYREYPLGAQEAVAAVLHVAVWMLGYHIANTVRVK